jgi:hypothetical protein
LLTVTSPWSSPITALTTFNIFFLIDTSKDFVVRRYKVQHALNFLTANNPAFQT